MPHPGAGFAACVTGWRKALLCREAVIHLFG